MCNSPCLCPPSEATRDPYNEVGSLGVRVTRMSGLLLSCAGCLESRFHLGRLITECELGIMSCVVKLVRSGGYLLPQ